MYRNITGLETLGELEREHPAEHENDGHDLDVDVRGRAAAVQCVPDDRHDAERERRQLSQVAEQSREQSKRGDQCSEPEPTRQPAALAALRVRPRIFTLNGGTSRSSVPGTVASSTLCYLYSRGLKPITTYFFAAYISASNQLYIRF